MTRKLLTATLKSSYSTSSNIDAEAGVIRGVKLMELGKLAKFAGENGEQKQVTISSDHISALLAHAGNRAIPIHETHEWFAAQDKPEADSVERNARIGALKAFRRDEQGNLIADAHLNLDKQPAKDLLWGAANNPEDNCFSVVFSYLKDDPQCIPQNFRAADVVPSGAATTALFSEDQTQNKSMDISELITMLSDPSVKDAIKAIIKSVEANEPDVTDTEAATMESDAGVTDADKKKEDDKMPATMRAMVRINRATARMSKAFATEKVALLAEVEVKAGAAATALLGKGGFIKQGDGNQNGDTYTATLATYTEKADGNVIKGTALMLKARPEFLGEYEKRTRERVAKFHQPAA